MKLAIRNKMEEIIKHSKPFVDEKDMTAVSEVIESGMHATRDIVEKFESRMCNFIGMKHARATNSGTTALHLALLSLGVKEKDEVILPSYVCQAVLNSVNYVKATPILVDIQDDFDKGFNISHKKIKPLITKKTKAIILPHMFGYPAEIDKIIPLGVPIIEDCSLSLGAKYKERKIGSFGEISTFSFFAPKVISTGHGGLVATNSEKIKKKLDELTKYDKRDKYEVAYNYNMTDIQAALGISQLNKINYFIQRRKDIASEYNKAFSKYSNKLMLPKRFDGSFPFRYIIQFNTKKERDSIKESLKSKGIICELPVFNPLHTYLRLNKNKFKNTELAHKRNLSIPLYPAMTEKEVERVINESVSEFSKLFDKT